jgi:pentatricopeptide repeat protein
MDAAARHRYFPTHFTFFPGTKVQILTQQLGIAANVRLYSAAINACGRAGRLEEAVAVFDCSQRAGVRPNVVLYTSLIHACQVAGDVDAATHYLQEMVRLNEALSY